MKEFNHIYRSQSNGPKAEPELQTEPEPNPNRFSSETRRTQTDADSGVLSKGQRGRFTS